jgi:hypothetical protein
MTMRDDILVGRQEIACEPQHGSFFKNSYSCVWLSTLHIEIDIVFGSDDGHSTEATTLFLTITESANRDSSLNAAVNTPSPTAADLDNPAAEGGATHLAVQRNSETMQSMAAATPPPLLWTGDLPSEGDAPPVEPVVGSGMGNHEQYTSPPEPSGYDQNPTGVAPLRAANPDSYDNSPLSESYFPPQLDDGFGAHGRPFSTGGLGCGPPALLPSAPSVTPFPSSYSGRRVRRWSVGPGSGLAGHVSMSDPYPRWRHHQVPPFGWTS